MLIGWYRRLAMLVNPFLAALYATPRVAMVWKRWPSKVLKKFSRFMPTTRTLPPTAGTDVGRGLLGTNSADPFSDFCVILQILNRLFDHILSRRIQHDELVRRDVRSLEV